MQVMKIFSNDAINGNHSYNQIMLGNNILFNAFTAIFRFESEYVNYASETN